ncbi:MAG: DUF4823 domain-containing protein, partial [Deltaproteobacteria bacterium]|nr:DUF4823 domain-containing protein [Deltaproteobacteria bacterium]
NDAVAFSAKRARAGESDARGGAGDDDLHSLPPGTRQYGSPCRLRESAFQSTFVALTPLERMKLQRNDHGF